MRRTATALLGLALAASGCAVAVGGPLDECAAGVEPVGIAVPESGVQAPETVSLECYRVVRDSRIEVLFTMPPGPDCHGVSVVDAVESADAVSIELQIGKLANPIGGACPEEPMLRAVQVELNGAIEGRQVLDASRPPS